MKKLLITGAIATLGISMLFAQNAERPRQGGPGGPGGQGPGAGARMNPLMAALDTNNDGELDATEIANASASLKKLDKNGDGKLTRDELRPERPAGAAGQREGRPGGRGERGQQGN